MSEPFLSGFEDSQGEREEQYRLRLLQLKDWGTFSGVHRIAVSGHGHLLLGKSGSGKTTLLDAHMTLLSPKRWIDYNAAAREDGERKADRSVLSYIRGEYNAKSDLSSRDVLKDYLRPPNTWSVIAETYENLLGATVTLVLVLLHRGTATDETRRYLIIRDAFDIKTLAFLAQEGFEGRVFKKHLPQAEHFTEYKDYGARLRSIFTIDSEQGLKLLMRTISARNVADLDEFVRQNMLDPPETFEMAKAFATGCKDLFETHLAMETAERQIAHLKPVKDGYSVHLETRRQENALEEELSGFEGYRARIVIAQLQREDAELAARQHALQDELEGLKRAVRDARAREEEYRVAIREKGGPDLEAKRQERRRLLAEQAQREAARTNFVRSCRALGYPEPRDAAAFAALKEGLARRTAELDREVNGIADERVDLKNELIAADGDCQRHREELRSLEGRTSNIDRRLIAARADICAATGLTAADLPFAGELMEVTAEESPWRPVIERTLAALGNTMLVRERDHEAVAEYLDNNRVQDGQISYLRMLPLAGKDHGIGGHPRHLERKLAFRACDQERWLRGWIRERHGFICADDLAEFHTAEKALTRNGLRKDNRWLHVKDDRTFPQDRWSLGFTNDEKVEIHRKGLLESAARLQEVKDRLADWDERFRTSRALEGECQKLDSIDWNDIDVEETARAVGMLAVMIAAFERDHADLAELEQAREEAEKETADLEERVQEVATAIGDCNGIRGQLGREMDSRREAAAKGDEDVQARIAARIAQSRGAIEPQLQWQQADKKLEAAKTAFLRELKELGTRVTEQRDRIEEGLRAFKRENPALTANIVDGAIGTIGEYLWILEKLEEEALPQARERFERYMREQSHNSLLALKMKLHTEKREIHSRLVSVNAVLRKSVYDRHGDRPTYIQIESRDLSIGEVGDFALEVADATEDALVFKAELAERQYGIVKALVARIESDEPKDRAWRALVLDVRRHVEFLAHEYVVDETGVPREIQTLLGGGGKSGGQRQKLAATCLAAALRYQLGGQDMRLPRFATVVIDEAFSKADAEYTGEAIQTFLNFGFQMILSTPEKSINACMPYVRGATMVTNQDRKDSRTANIEYDLERLRLRLPELAAGDAVTG